MREKPRELPSCPGGRGLPLGAPLLGALRRLPSHRLAGQTSPAPANWPNSPEVKLLRFGKVHLVAVTIAFYRNMRVPVRGTSEGAKI